MKTMKENSFSKRKRSLAGFLILIVTVSMWGCAREQQREVGENVIITETGEIVEKESPVPKATPSPKPSPTVSPEVIQLTEKLEEPKETQVVTENADTAPEDPDALQIVFLGDSIFDNNRDESGIVYQVGKACGASVYNLSIGGSRATLAEGEPRGYTECNSRGLIGMSLVLAGLADVSQLQIEGTRAWEHLNNLKDISNTDYFVVEYGINDFFSVVPLSSDAGTDDFDPRTYVGALRSGVENLRTAAPNAEIILCSPHYAQFFHDGVMVGDGNVLNNGYGTLFDYKGICQYVSNEKGTMFMDAYINLGINGNTADEYLSDGVHLTAAGRKLYADYLSNMISKHEETRNN